MQKIVPILGVIAISALIACSAANAQGGIDRSVYNAIADHINRGNRMLTANNLSGAMAEYEAAKSLDPKNPSVKQALAECHNHMGINQFRRKAYSDALAEFQKCVEIFPSHAQARRNISLCKQAMDREGIADTPPDSGDPPESKKTADKDAGKDANSEKNKDKAPEASVSASGSSASSSGSASISAGGQALYMSGNPMYPTYSTTPTGASIQTAPTNPVEKKVQPSKADTAAAASARAASRGTVNAGGSAGTAGSANSGSGSTSAISPSAAGSSNSQAGAAGSDAPPAVAPFSTPPGSANNSASPQTNKPPSVSQAVSGDAFDTGATASGTSLPGYSAATPATETPVAARETPSAPTGSGVRTRTGLDAGANNLTPPSSANSSGITAVPGLSSAPSSNSNASGISSVPGLSNSPSTNANSSGISSVPGLSNVSSSNAEASGISSVPGLSNTPSTNADASGITSVPGLSNIPSGTEIAASQGNSAPTFPASSAEPNAVSAPATNSVAGTSDSLTTGEKVALLEQKVYGKKNTELSLQQRIEKLETDQFGKIRPGTWPERIENLKKAIGL